VSRRLPATAILLGAALLFAVQPMAGKLVLPALGGAPAVWNSAMLVYQALLLGGYAYAHWLGRVPPRMQAAIHLGVLALAALWLPAAHAKSTECAKIGVCYCVNDELKDTIKSRVEKFRALIAEQRKAGKQIGYLSVPLTTTGGGHFDVNMEVAGSAKAAIEKRLGTDFVWVLNPGTLEADLPKGTGADYMMMWITLLEGPDGMGDFDFVQFAGPQDFARYFGFDGNNDMAKLDAYFDKRVKSDPEFEKAVTGGSLTKAAFRRYYGLRASSTVSRGAHDEWNIFRLINEKRRADPKLGTTNQIPMYFDGRAAAPAEAELSVSEGYVGKCPV
jgi:hypothetical protein